MGEIEEGRRYAAERERVGVLATPNVYLSVCGGGCVHLSSSIPAFGYVRWLT